MLRSVISPWLVLASAFISVGAPQDTGPSFSCAHVTSQVNKLICGTPELSRLDRQLVLSPVLGIQGNVKCHQPESGE